MKNQEFEMKKETIIKGFAEIINKNSFENHSNTPDFILAEYLTRCLEAFDIAVRRRDNWYTPPDAPRKWDSDGD